MPTQDDIDDQQALLVIHRRTLAILLRQLANLGADHALPAARPLSGLSRSAQSAVLPQNHTFTDM